MKKSIFIILGAILFALFFYEKFLGLNTLLFGLYLIITVASFQSSIFKKATAILSAVSMIACAVAITYHGSGWSMFMYFASGFTFLGYAVAHQSSIYVSWLNGIYNFFFGAFNSLLQPVSRPKPLHESNASSSKIDSPQLARLIIIPLLLVIVFASLYSFTNPVITSWIDQIDFSFFNIFWVLFALLGALIMTNVIYSKPLEELTKTDISTGNHLKVMTITDQLLPKVKNEVQVGTYSMVGLNLLLFVVLITELVFLMNMNDFRASVLSEAVHTGVYASIASIVMAVVLIVFFFRGSVNFIKENKTLKTMTYTWIGLNLLLVASIFIKNYIYITDHGLTHKRIGVMVYLLLCTIGLVTTYLKVSERFNVVYLLRRNMAIGFGIILIYSTINWSASITRYNLENDHIDTKYLTELMPQNAVVLQEFDLLKNYESQLPEYHRYSNHKNYMEFYNRSWQDFNWIAYQIKPNTDDTTTD